VFFTNIFRSARAVAGKNSNCLVPAPASPTTRSRHARLACESARPTKSTSSRGVHLLIRELNDHLQIVLAASELGYYETALEAQLSAKEVLDAMRVDLLRPHGPEQHPCRELDS